MVKGIVRKFDQVGRIVVPKEYIKALNLSSRSPIEIIQVDNTLVLRPVTDDVSLTITQSEANNVLTALDVTGADKVLVNKIARQIQHEGNRG